MASLQSLPQELVGNIFAFLADKRDRQSFYTASPVVSRAPSVVQQVTAITVDGSMPPSPAGGNPFDTVPKDVHGRYAPLRELTLVFPRSSSADSLCLASYMTSTLKASPGLLAGLEKITFDGLAAKDLPMLEMVALVCRSLRKINIITDGKFSHISPSDLPAQLPNSLASLSGLSELQLTVNCSSDGNGWSDVASNHLMAALAVCTTIRSLFISDRTFGEKEWIPRLVSSLPNLEHLALGGQRCDMEIFLKCYSREDLRASIRSLCVEEIGILGLASFLSKMCVTPHDCFPLLKSMEIGFLDWEFTYTKEVPTSGVGDFWHGRSGSVDVFVSQELEVDEGWLLFLLDKGLRLDALQSLKLRKWTDGLDEQRTPRLLAEELPGLQRLHFVNHYIEDYHVFLATCIQELQSLKELDIEHACHSQDNLEFLGQVACALCERAAFVERAHPLNIGLRIREHPIFSPSRDAQVELKHRVDVCIGALMQSVQNASSVRFHAELLPAF